MMQQSLFMFASKLGNIKSLTVKTTLKTCLKNVLCGFGLLIIITITISVLVLGTDKHILPDLLEVFGVCIVAFMANVFWFFAAFRSSRKLHKGSIMP
ncbi:DUF5391 family protein [Bacillaceae bacterium Marseille-Q3522]|nr:DUF5391 family protein [Bacillaceae bacterium Marseille-Q3522]